MSHSDSADENDPEIQRNAFEVYADEFGLPPDVAETFIDEHFDPEAPFHENNARWWRWFRDAAEDVVQECPTCGGEIEDTVPVDAQGERAETKDDAVGVVMLPCEDVVSLG